MPLTFFIVNITICKPESRAYETQVIKGELGEEQIIGLYESS